MIAVDSSALVAIVLGEADAETLARVMQRQQVLVSAASLTEAAIVLEARQGLDAVRDLKLLLESVGAQIQAVDAQLAWTAHAAWQRFGKGRHPAALNFGDCFSYALATTADIVLLYKGDDFTQTDIKLAV